MPHTRHDLYSVEMKTRPHRPSHDQWMVTPGDPDYLAPADRWCRVCALPDSDPIHGDTSYADEHECGQLRIAVPGEQVSLLPLPDSLIPTTHDEPCPCGATINEEPATIAECGCTLP